jgi:hypothetical protein
MKSALFVSLVVTLVNRSISASTIPLSPESLEPIKDIYWTQLIKDEATFLSSDSLRANLSALPRVSPLPQLASFSFLFSPSWERLD